MQLTFEDYDLTVEQVARAERKPRTPQDVLDSFVFWVSRNGEAMAEMREHALDLADRGRRVSAKYLVEWLRYEADARIVGDAEHEWKVPNEYTPLIARYLAIDSPQLKPFIEFKQSEFDKLDLPPIHWGFRCS